MYVVPEPSERCTTAMSVAGGVPPWFSFSISWAFHFCAFPGEDTREGDHAARSRRELLVRHRPVGGAEEDGLVRELPDPPARADRRIVDLNVRMLLVVLVEPFRVDGEGKRSSRAVDLDRLGLGRRPEEESGREPEEGGLEADIQVHVISFVSR